jgi:hypothetical protein
MTPQDTPCHSSKLCDIMFVFAQPVTCAGGPDGVVMVPFLVVLELLDVDVDEIISTQA